MSHEVGRITERCKGSTDILGTLKCFVVKLVCKMVLQTMDNVRLNIHVINVAYIKLCEGNAKVV
jgi:hypothetical protein